MAHPMFTPFEPNVSFRYMLTSEKLKTTDIGFLCKAISLPSIDQGEVVIDYVNTDFKVKGKSRWQDVTLSIYDAIGLEGKNNPQGQKQIHNWLLNHHNSQYGKDDWAFPEGTAVGSPGYKDVFYIHVLQPDGSKSYNWELHGAFMSAINFGNMDWAAEDAVIAEITIKYDWAKLNA